MEAVYVVAGGMRQERRTVSPVLGSSRNEARVSIRPITDEARRIFFLTPRPLLTLLCSTPYHETRNLVWKCTYMPIHFEYFDLKLFFPVSLHYGPVSFYFLTFVIVGLISTSMTLQKDQLCAYICT